MDFIGGNVSSFLHISRNQVYLQSPQKIKKIGQQTQSTFYSIEVDL